MRRRRPGCLLELGGKNPVIILTDADLVVAIQGAVCACFTNAGLLKAMKRLHLK
ncbi:aldehyde dehydrogenase family protein [Streptosporangium sandarakinum]|uniref:aldehyde dehydrogenase family protein n=1 Tax=Streptosporangium sandarakinum TaxID=1260955 RepID=UPI0036C7ABAB